MDVFEVRDCEGICHGVFEKELDASEHCAALASLHPDFPRGFFVTPGAVSLQEFKSRFEKEPPPKSKHQSNPPRTRQKRGRPARSRL